VKKHMVVEMCAC